MWIYWKEQCKYCKNRENCEYKKKVSKYIEALASLENLADGVYGTTKFTCDYNVIDEEEYRKNHVGECCCTAK